MGCLDSGQSFLYSKPPGDNALSSHAIALAHSAHWGDWLFFRIFPFYISSFGRLLLLVFIYLLICLIPMALRYYALFQNDGSIGTFLTYLILSFSDFI